MTRSMFRLLLIVLAAVAAQGALGSVTEAAVLPYAPLQAQAYVDDEGFVGTRIEWDGGPWQHRSVHLIDNTQQDPSGHWGGYARTITYGSHGTERTCRASNDDYPGFGMVVNHIAGGSENSVRNRGERAQLLFAGNNHALYGYRWHYRIGGVPVVIHVQWLFVTGHAAPVYAITYDLSAVAPGALVADTRAPYGDIDWDGGQRANVDGVAWGDDMKFRSIGSPVTLANGWCYDEANVVPFTKSFAVAADAEMGLVQTQTQAQHSAGGYHGFSAWGSCNERGPMPEQSNWPYQLNQWQLPGYPAAKRMAWGSNFGAVGQSWYQTIGDVQYARGYPYQSYSVYVVMDTHQAAPVDAQVAAVEASQLAVLAAEDNVHVRRKGPGGVGRTDQVPFAVLGLNPVYNTWELRVVDSDQPASFTLTPAAHAALRRPTFVVHGLDHVPGGGVVIDGRVATNQVDYFLSEDPDNHRVWLTLATNVVRKVEVSLLPQGSAQSSLQSLLGTLRL